MNKALLNKKNEGRKREKADWIDRWIRRKHGSIL
jgi:hypothetical protein